MQSLLLRAVHHQLRLAMLSGQKKDPYNYFGSAQELGQIAWEYCLGQLSLF